jgi:hypothetical protein
MEKDLFARNPEVTWMSPPRRPAYSNARNADNSLPLGKVKDSLPRAARSDPCAIRHFLILGGFATLSAEKSSNFKGRYGAHGSGPETLSLSPERLYSPPPRCAPHH